MHDDDDDDDSYDAEEDEDDDDEDYRRDDDYDVVDNKSLIWPLKYLNSQLIHVIIYHIYTCKSLSSYHTSHNS